MLKEKYIESPAELESGKVFLEFYAPRCSFCRAAEPTVERLSGEHENVKFFKINTDESPKAAESFGIRGLPTFVVMQDGSEKGRITGARPESALRELLGRLD